MFWGVSAAGSAQRWQRWGQGFKSPTFHFIILMWHILPCKA